MPEGAGLDDEIRCFLRGVLAGSVTIRIWGCLMPVLMPAAASILHGDNAILRSLHREHKPGYNDISDSRKHATRPRGTGMLRGRAAIAGSEGLIGSGSCLRSICLGV